MSEMPIPEKTVDQLIRTLSDDAATGVLRLRNGSEEVSIDFVRGCIVRVVSSSRPPHELLGHMLCAAGVLTQAQLDTLLGEQRDEAAAGSRLPLGARVVARGLASSAQVRRLLRAQIINSLSAIVLWTQFAHEFRSSAVELPDVDSDDLSAAPVAPDALWLEAVCRAQARRQPATVGEKMRTTEVV